MNKIMISIVDIYAANTTAAAAVCGDDAAAATSSACYDAHPQVTPLRRLLNQLDCSSTNSTSPQSVHGSCMSNTPASQIISSFLAAYTLKIRQNSPSRLNLLEQWLLCSVACPWLFSMRMIITSDTVSALSDDIPQLMYMRLLSANAISALAQTLGDSLAAALDSLDNDPSISTPLNEFINLLARKLLILKTRTSASVPYDNDTSLFYIAIMDEVYKRSVLAARKLSLLHMSFYLHDENVSRTAKHNHMAEYVSAVINALSLDGAPSVPKSTLTTINSLFQWSSPSTAISILDSLACIASSQSTCLSSVFTLCRLYQINSPSFLSEVRSWTFNQISSESAFILGLSLTYVLSKSEHCPSPFPVWLSSALGNVSLKPRDQQLILSALQYLLPTSPPAFQTACLAGVKNHAVYKPVSSFVMNPALKRKSPPSSSSLPSGSDKSINRKPPTTLSILSAYTCSKVIPRVLFSEMFINEKWYRSVLLPELQMLGTEASRGLLEALKTAGRLPKGFVIDSKDVAHVKKSDELLFAVLEKLKVMEIPSTDSKSTITPSILSSLASHFKDLSSSVISSADILYITAPGDLRINPKSQVVTSATLDAVETLVQRAYQNPHEPTHVLIRLVLSQLPILFPSLFLRIFSMSRVTASRVPDSRGCSRGSACKLNNNGSNISFEAVAKVIVDCLLGIPESMKVRCSNSVSETKIYPEEALFYGLFFSPVNDMGTADISQSTRMIASMIKLVRGHLAHATSQASTPGSSSSELASVCNCGMSEARLSKWTIHLEKRLFVYQQIIGALYDQRISLYCLEPITRVADITWIFLGLCFNNSLSIYHGCCDRCLLSSRTDSDSIFITARTWLSSSIIESGGHYDCDFLSAFISACVAYLSCYPSSFLAVRTLCMALRDAMDVDYVLPKLKMGSQASWLSILFKTTPLSDLSVLLSVCLLLPGRWLWMDGGSVVSALILKDARIFWDSCISTLVNEEWIDVPKLASFVGDHYWSFNATDMNEEERISALIEQSPVLCALSIASRSIGMYFIPENALTRLIGTDLIKWINIPYSASHPVGLGAIIASSIFHRLLLLTDVDDKRKYIIFLVQALTESATEYQSASVVTLQMLHDTALLFQNRIENKMGSDSDMRSIQSVLTAIQSFVK